MSHKYKLAVFIGRFQIYHNGHHQVVSKALEIADRVAVLVGSANEPRSYRNPFNFGERVEMIDNAFDLNERRRLDFHAVEDRKYDDEAWVCQIQQIVENYGFENEEIALIGLEKDHTSYYLKLFPQWNSASVKQDHILSSTDMRKFFFDNSASEDIESMIPRSTFIFLNRFWAHNSAYYDVVAEYKFIEKYKKQWASSPYPPTFVTVDAVVIQSGHILMVERADFPGKGLWALPGGYLGQNETIIKGILRELKEETKIKVPPAVLTGSHIATKVFDCPHRSDRGRVITHVGLFHLPNDGILPKVKGSDDARKAEWKPLGTLNRSWIFEDHTDIIQDMRGLL